MGFCILQNFDQCEFLSFMFHFNQEGKQVAERKILFLITKKLQLSKTFLVFLFAYFYSNNFVTFLWILKAGPFLFFTNLSLVAQGKFDMAQKWIKFLVQDTTIYFVYISFMILYINQSDTSKFRFIINNGI